MRKSRGKTHVLSLLGAVLLMVSPVVCFSQNLPKNLGQSKIDVLPPPKPLTPNCTAADLDASIQAAEGPNALYTLAINYRKISGHDCRLGQSSEPGVNPWTFPNGKPFQLCHDCLGPIPERVHPTFEPLVLKKDETAHQAFSWRTEPADNDAPCLQLEAMGMSIGQGPQQPYNLFQCPALLKKVCSPVQFGGFAAGPFRENSPQVGMEVPSLELFQDSTPYYPGQKFDLEGRASEPAALLPSSPQTCPVMLRRLKDSNGDTQWDQLSYKWCKPEHTVGQGPGGQIGLKIDAPQIAGGNHSISLIQVLPADENGDVAMAESNTIHLYTVDTTTMPRHWGQLVKGIAVDVTLDKQTFALGENVPLHIALENFSGDVPVVGMTPLWDPGMVVTVDVLDAWHHRIEPSGRSGYYFGHGRWLLYQKGVLVPMEESLKDEGLLPTEPGTYTVTVTWSPHTCMGPDCGQSGGVRGEPYATVQDTESFEVIDINHP